MTFNIKNLIHYKKYFKLDFVPIHPWNKMIKGKEAGKKPVHKDWVTKEYKDDDHLNWIRQGYNLGYRIDDNELIVDMDPRNYEKENCTQKIAELFGFDDFIELKEWLPVVKTGGGGYHIYCKLPENLDIELLRETVEDLPGIEFKKKGRQVLTAGSRHLSGKYYSWLNVCEPEMVPKSLLNLITRKKIIKQDYSLGRGSLTGAQLEDLVLNKLKPTDYSGNDRWWPLLCAAHHGTNGEGIEEFLQWSLSDPDYADCENEIRGRWESLWDKENSITIGSIVHELSKLGEDTNDLKAVLQFSNVVDFDTDEDIEDDETQLLKEANELTQQIEASDLFEDEDLGKEAGVSGAAIEAAKELSPTSDNDEIMKCLRLIKAADTLEATKAKEILVDRKILKMASINKIMKDLEAKFTDDLAMVISSKMLENVFNNAKHLTCTPSNLLYAFHKTHWKRIGDNFLNKLILNTIHNIRKKLDFKASEAGLMSQASLLTKAKVATLNDKIHKTSLPPSVINCLNGELWMKPDGTHTLKPHSYRSYLLSCLNVRYNPSSECPLFIQTLEQIFENYDDCYDIVRHIGEIMGYMAQPYKNIASWFLFRGPGGDGKSTILKILDGILMDSMLMSTIKLLSSGGTDGYNHALASVVGKLCLVIEEVPVHYLLNDAGLKMLSENTKMEANPKSKEQFQFMYSAGLIMCSNGYPSTRDVSHAMFRRAHVVPFNRKFTETGKEDLNRAQRILQNPEEMSGILNFMLDGLQRLRNRGNFEIPHSCKIAKNEWFGESNNVVRFVRERIEITGNLDDCLGTLSHIYGAVYGLWCQNNDIDEKMRKNRGNFKKDMNNLGLVTQTGGQNILKIYGGKLKETEGNEIVDFEDLEYREDW